MPSLILWCCVVLRGQKHTGIQAKTPLYIALYTFPLILCQCTLHGKKWLSKLEKDKTSPLLCTQCCHQSQSFCSESENIRPCHLPDKEHRHDRNTSDISALCEGELYGIIHKKSKINTPVELHTCPYDECHVCSH